MRYTDHNDASDHEMSKAFEVLFTQMYAVCTVILACVLTRQKICKTTRQQSYMFVYVFPWENKKGKESQMQNFKTHGGKIKSVLFI